MSNTNTLLRTLFTICLYIGMTIPMLGKGPLYTADNLMGDSITAYIAKSENGKYIKTEESTNITNGETIEYIQSFESEYSSEKGHFVGEINDTAYIISPNSVRFSQENEAVSENIVQNYTQRLEHSAIGHFFYSPGPFILVFIFATFSGLCLLFAYRNFKKTKDNLKMMLFVPVGLLLTSVVELLSLIYAGGDATWWCTPDNVGFATSILYSFPVMVGIGLQIIDGYYYKRLLEDMTRTVLSWKSVFIGVGISIPLALVIVIILAINGFKNSVMQDVIIVSLIIAAIAIGFFIAFWKNKKQLGTKLGLLFTSFSFIYAIGVIFATVLMIFIIFKLLIALLVYLVAFIGAIFGLGMAFGGSGASGGTTTYKTVYLDDKGGEHDTAYGAEQANKDAIFKS